MLSELVQRSMFGIDDVVGNLKSVSSPLK